MSIREFHYKITDFFLRKRMKRGILAVSLFLILYGSIGYVPRNFMSETVRTIICILGVMLTGLCCRPKMNISSTIIFTVLSAMGTTSAVLAGDGLKLVLFPIVAMCIAFVLVSFVDFESFKTAFSDVMVFTSLFSIIITCTYAVCPELIKLFPKLPVAGADVYSGFFGVVKDDFYRLRLCGFAWEPGAFQTFINIAILIVGIKKEHRVFKLAVLYIALIITLSTTGYIVGAFNFVIIVLQQNINSPRRLKKYLFLTGVAFAVFMVGATYVGITEMVFRKILLLFDGLSVYKPTSASARLAAMYYPLLVFLKSPLIGSGETGLNNLVGTVGDVSCVCTPVNYLAMYGIFYTAIVFVCLYKFNKMILGKNRLVIFAGLASFILGIISEQYVNYIILDVFIMYGSTLVLDKLSFVRKKQSENIIS